MGRIPEAVVKESLGSLMETLIKNNVEDAAVLFMGIGDHTHDSFPLQLGQFESGTVELDKWLTSLNIEKGGGGTSEESYLLAWLIAARHTSIDCFEKRGQKGFLFTIGDEMTHSSVNASWLKSALGYPQASDITAEQLLREAERLYNIFHIHVNEGSYRDDPRVLAHWRKLLGQRLIVLDDYRNLCEVISSTVAAVNGASLADIVKDFDPSTAMAVTTAVSLAVTAVSTPNLSGAVIKL
jgi:hypothetical protein